MKKRTKLNERSMNKKKENKTKINKNTTYKIHILSHFLFYKRKWSLKYLQHFK